MTTLMRHQQRPHLVVTNHVQEEVIDFLSEFARVTANRMRLAVTRANSERKSITSSCTWFVTTRWGRC